MKRLMITFLVLCGMTSRRGQSTNSIAEVRAAIVSLEEQLTRDQKNVGEILDCGISFSTKVEYTALSRSVSNNWQHVLANLGNCTTSQLERLIVLSVRDKFGADFYLEFVNRLVDLKTNSVLSAEELDWAIHTEVPELETYFERKYRVPKVRALAVRLRSVGGHQDYWNRVLSGAAYTNYLGEVEAGLWGDNPPR